MNYLSKLRILNQKLKAFAGICYVYAGDMLTCEVDPNSEIRNQLL